MEELPNIIQRIGDDYFIETEDKYIIIDKIERFD